MIEILNEGQSQLRAAIRRESLTYSQVATRLAVTVKSVKWWTSGTCIPVRLRRETIERIYGVDPQAWFRAPYDRPNDPVQAPQTERLVLVLDVRLVKAIDVRRRSMARDATGSVMSRAQVIRMLVASGLPGLASSAVTAKSSESEESLGSCGELRGRDCAASPI